MQLHDVRHLRQHLAHQVRVAHVEEVVAALCGRAARRVEQLQLEALAGGAARQVRRRAADRLDVRRVQDGGDHRDAARHEHRRPLLVARRLRLQQPRTGAHGVHAARHRVAAQVADQARDARVQLVLQRDEERDGAQRRARRRRVEHHLPHDVDAGEVEVEHLERAVRAALQQPDGAAAVVGEQEVGAQAVEARARHRLHAAHVAHLVVEEAERDLLREEGAALRRRRLGGRGRAVRARLGGLAQLLARVGEPREADAALALGERARVERVPQRVDLLGRQHDVRGAHDEAEEHEQLLQLVQEAVAAVADWQRLDGLLTQLFAHALRHARDGVGRHLLELEQHGEPRADEVVLELEARDEVGARHDALGAALARVRHDDGAQQAHRLRARLARRDVRQTAAHERLAQPAERLVVQRALQRALRLLRQHVAPRRRVLRADEQQLRRHGRRRVARARRRHVADQLDGERRHLAGRHAAQAADHERALLLGQAAEQLPKHAVDLLPLLHRRAVRRRDSPHVVELLRRQRAVLRQEGHQAQRALHELHVRAPQEVVRDHVVVGDEPRQQLRRRPQRDVHQVVLGVLRARRVHPPRLLEALWEALAVARPLHHGQRELEAVEAPRQHVAHRHLSSHVELQRLDRLRRFEGAVAPAQQPAQLARDLVQRVEVQLPQARRVHRHQHLLDGVEEGGHPVPGEAASEVLGDVADGDQQHAQLPDRDRRRLQRLDAREQHHEAVVLAEPLHEVDEEVRVRLARAAQREHRVRVVGVVHRQRGVRLQRVAGQLALGAHRPRVERRDARRGRGQPLVVLAGPADERHVQEQHFLRLPALALLILIRGARAVLRHDRVAVLVHRQWRLQARVDHDGLVPVVRAVLHVHHAADAQAGAPTLVARLGGRLKRQLLGRRLRRRGGGRRGRAARLGAKGRQPLVAAAEPVFLRARLADHRDLQLRLRRRHVDDGAAHPLVVADLHVDALAGRQLLAPVLVQLDAGARELALALRAAVGRKEVLPLVQQPQQHDVQLRDVLRDVMDDHRHHVAQEHLDARGRRHGVLVRALEQQLRESRQSDGEEVIIVRLRAVVARDPPNPPGNLLQLRAHRGALGHQLRLQQRAVALEIIERLDHDGPRALRLSDLHGDQALWRRPPAAKTPPPLARAAASARPTRHSPHLARSHAIERT
mmetsp:Transcript_18056/g.63867  ORF Transcript_18056/g.63867 Transcript_18056/m.63867 type:complete len:1174 (-) Transcript_18056:269-3790(-)